jgi:hypothetical protein
VGVDGHADRSILDERLVGDGRGSADGHLDRGLVARSALDPASIDPKA